MTLAEIDWGALGQAAWTSVAIGLGVLLVAGVAADRSVAVAASLEGNRSARENGVYLAIAVARGLATPEQLRRAGAHTVVAELHELL